MMTRDLRQVISATGRVLRDSNRTDDILLVAEITSRRRLGRIVDELRHDPRGRRLLETRPTLGPDDVDLDRLQAMDRSTLGASVARHLHDNDLKLYAGPVSDEYLPDPDARYVMLRYRQLHDVWHVLLGLGTEGHEEVLVHAFTLGHLRLPNSALIVALGSIKHLVLERRWNAIRRGLAEAYRSGQAAANLLLVDWSGQWERPLTAVREDVRVSALHLV